MSGRSSFTDLMSDRGSMKSRPLRQDSTSDRSNSCTETPSSRESRKRKADYRALAQEDSSEDEYVPASDITKKPTNRKSRHDPHPTPVRKPGYFMTAYPCYECKRDGQNCFVPNDDNAGPCLYTPCIKGGKARCCGHQRVIMPEKKPEKKLDYLAAQLRHRIQLVLKKAANKGHKMSATGEYLEWTPIMMMVSLDGRRTAWAETAKSEDPTLEQEVDNFLAEQKREASVLDEKKKRKSSFTALQEEAREEEESLREFDRGGGSLDAHHTQAFDQTMEEDQVNDPLKDVLRDVMPKKLSELHEYLETLYKAKGSLDDQVDAIKATIVQVKYKISTHRR